MGRKIVFKCVLVFCFLFSTQNQVPQIINGQRFVIYYIKALSVVIRTTTKIPKKLFPLSRENGLNFFNFSSNTASDQAYNSLFRQNLGPKNLT